LVIVALSALAWWLADQSEGRMLAKPTVPPESTLGFVLPHSPAPLPDITFRNREGHRFRIADFRGQVVLLNIWATWCAPCREEMPDLQTLADRYEADGLQVVGVSIDQAGARAQVRRFVDRHDIGFAILHDPEGRVSRVFGTVGVPETILIDERGRIHARWTGRIPVAEAEAKVREVLLE
ncbi:MAG TPA: TlpA disulfide reductase family protein, partial [Longimicrobiales bacterium]|nr:TlpA disulfide reductase family protein [Longimicrobiales bacterium]